MLFLQINSLGEWKKPFSPWHCSAWEGIGKQIEITCAFPLQTKPLTDHGWIIHPCFVLINKDWIDVACSSLSLFPSISRAVIEPSRASIECLSLDHLFFEQTRACWGAVRLNFCGKESETRFLYTLENLKYCVPCTHISRDNQFQLFFHQCHGPWIVVNDWISLDWISL